MLAARIASNQGWIFPGKACDAPLLGTSVDQMHKAVRKELGFQSDFVIHSLRHTMFTRLGEAGADAFTIMSDRRA